ncbi:MAG: hypothetical protein ACKVP5_24305 [Aestuariivirga sp.]
MMAVFLGVVMAISTIVIDMSASHARGIEISCSTVSGPVAEGAAKSSVDQKTSAAGVAELSRLVENKQPGGPERDGAKAECCEAFCGSGFNLAQNQYGLIAMEPASFELAVRGCLHGLRPEGLKRPPRVPADQNWRA